MNREMDKKEIRKFVGNKIKEFRKKKGMTQKELGKKVGVKHNTISSYENGTNEAEQNILYLMSEVLEVSINDFFPASDRENYSNVVAEDVAPYHKRLTQEYLYYPTAISAGFPEGIEAITKLNKIEMPDSLMGKWAGNKSIKFMRVNGESMNRIIPNDSLIAVKPITLNNIRDGDIVVYSCDRESAVKRFYKREDKIILRPDSHDIAFTDHVVDLENNQADLVIHGKVVLYIVELD